MNMHTSSSTYARGGKPFNPLLGETYELVLPNKGFRFISEQGQFPFVQKPKKKKSEIKNLFFLVSHHPPISAVHCESSDWVVWTDGNFKEKLVKNKCKKKKK